MGQNNFPIFFWVCFFVSFFGPCLSRISIQLGKVIGWENIAHAHDFFLAAKIKKKLAHKASFSLVLLGGDLEKVTVLLPDMFPPVVQWVGQRVVHRDPAPKVHKQEPSQGAVINLDW